MGCGCGKKSTRLAAKKAVVATATPASARPAIWNGHPTEEEQKS